MNIDDQVNRKVKNQPAIDFWETLRSQESPKYWISKGYKTNTKNMESLKMIYPILEKINEH